MDAQNIQILYGGAGTKKFDAYIAAPAAITGDADATAGAPGLILIEEIWGLNDHIRDVCNRFAAAGYIVLSPELLGETGIIEKITASQPALQEDLLGTDPEKKHAAQAKVREIMQPISTKEFAAGAMEKLSAAYEYLSKDPRIAEMETGMENGPRIGVLGFCFGGTYALHFATAESRLKACVVFYGQSPNPLGLVEKIPCPVLAVNGEKDERVIAGLPALAEAMAKYGKDFTSKVYPGVGHAFFNDTNKQAYDAAAAQDAWDVTIAFLDKNLLK